MCRFNLILLLCFCNTLLVFSQTSRQGKDYAVFFAVEDFEPGWNALPETIIESKAIKEELESNYGFTCELIENPSKQKIIDKIKHYNNIITNKDQVLFFFSTHGYYNPKSNDGYLIGRDGKHDDAQYGESWLDYDHLSRLLAHSEAKHILLALDACNAGSFGSRSKGGQPRGFAQKGDDCSAKAAYAMKKIGRQFCAASNKDERTPAESKFAAKFLETLENQPQDEILYFADLSAELLHVSDPLPDTGTFRGDEKGPGFFFLRKNSCESVVAPVLLLDPEESLWENVLKENTIDFYDYYLERYPKGKYVAIAKAEREWLRTVKINSCSGYSLYLSLYNNRHKKEVEAKCPELFKPKKESLPPSSLSSFSDNMVLVKGGSFHMGRAGGVEDEQPVHRVYLSDFYISKYEVTQREWKQVMGKNPPDLKFKDCDQCPVNNVSWKQVQIFIKKLNRKTGQNYRLPTEAEWEYAARGGWNSSGQSTNINNIAWYLGNAKKRTQPVGGKAPNKLGLYDMFGNVYEWCSDWYGIYTPSSKTNPTGIDHASTKVCRGGSYGDAEKYINLTNRGNGSVDSGTEYIGFRLAKPVEQ